RSKALVRRRASASGATAASILGSMLNRASGKASSSSSIVVIGSPSSPTLAWRTSDHGRSSSRPVRSVTRSRLSSWKASSTPSEAGDHLGEAEVLVEVVGRAEHLIGAGALQALTEDPGEAPGGGRLGRHVEEQVHPLVVVDLGGQEERRLALDHLLHEVALPG